MRILKKTKISY